MAAYARRGGSGGAAADDHPTDPGPVSFMRATIGFDEIVGQLVCPEHRRALRVAPDGCLSAGVPCPDGTLSCPEGCEYPVRGGVPRFTGRGHYANAFGLQWRRYPKTQLDSYTGQPISRDRLESCLGMKLDRLAGLKVLECGSGAGRFTEHLAGHGETLVSLDISDAVDANLKNCGGKFPYLLMQADVNRAPLPRGYFDVCLCLGVLQHTPSPGETVVHLVEHLKPGGLLAIDHYTRRPGPLGVGQYLTLAVPIRAVLKRLPPEAGLRATIALTAVCDPVRRYTCRVKWLDRVVSRLLPSMCYYQQFPQLDPRVAYEWNELDTHDYLTDYYQYRKSPEQVEAMLTGLGMEVLHCRRGGNGVEALARKPG